MPKSNWSQIADLFSNSMACMADANLSSIQMNKTKKLFVGDVYLAFFWGSV